jgi:hypothetical protein
MTKTSFLDSPFNYPLLLQVVAGIETCPTSKLPKRNIVQSKGRKTVSRALTKEDPELQRRACPARLIFAGGSCIPSEDGQTKAAAWLTSMVGEPTSISARDRPVSSSGG